MAQEEIYQVDINGAVYGLEDETARKDNVYSTTETDTGKKWIDGKPIYRKAGIYNNGASTGTGSIVIDATLTRTYIDTIIATGGSATIPSDNYTKVSVGGYTGHNYRANIVVTNSGLVKLSNATAFTNFKWWIEYTKA